MIHYHAGNGMARDRDRPALFPDFQYGLAQHQRVVGKYLVLLESFSVAATVQCGYSPGAGQTDQETGEAEQAHEAVHEQYVWPVALFTLPCFSLVLQRLAFVSIDEARFLEVQ